MTAFRDIYQDLPSRVYEVWQRTKAKPVRLADEQEEQPTDLSVTAMLMAAAAGLAMPFENLKDVGVGNGKKWQEHPMFSGVDGSLYRAVLQECNDFFKQPIQACPDLSGVVLIQCQELKGIKNAAATGQGDATMDIAKYDVRFAVKILRNALAHNNILSIPDGDAEITKLAFFSRSSSCPCNDRIDGWNVLIIPVQSFEKFLLKWFDRLKSPDSIRGAALAITGEKLGKPPTRSGRNK